MRDPVAVFDIGGTKTLVAAVRGREILARRVFPSEGPDFDALVVRCARTLGEVCREAGAAVGDLAALGVNLPGMVDPEHGMLVYAPFADVREYPARDRIAALTGIKLVAVENDVNACAVGELFFADEPCRDFLWQTISTGCGGAVVANGALVRGHGGCAGELGHIKVEYDAPRRCACGQWGCLEAHASGSQMGLQLAEAAALDPALAAAMRGRPATAETLCALAREGNGTASAMVENCGVRLGRALAAACNALNPARVYFGGGVARSLGLFLPAIRRTIAACAIGGCAGVELLPSALGADAATLGAAAVAYLAR